ncbi:MAG: carboxypeptidase regulatory-like domain-containing protein [Myxococcales bacterium]|nr:carboxypeptidase regulatory-like domain-containing protein [Myxococcales bacterium]
MATTTAIDDDAAREPAGDLQMEGMVLGVDEEPVAGAQVTLGDGQRAVTDASGSFVFGGLAEGAYDVAAELDSAFAEVQQVELDADSEPVSLRLTRGPTLVVRIVDERARPIADAIVAVGARSRVTPRDGIVRFRAIDLGLELVDVRAPDRAHVNHRVDSGEDPAATLECTIVLAAGSDLAGIVVDEAGRPVPEAYVELSASARGVLGETMFADEHGAWRMHHLATDTYTVRASSSTHVATEDLVLAHEGTRATSGVVIRVEPGGEIAGIVVDATGRPVEGAQVRAGTASETSDARGEFVLRGLAAEAHSVSVATSTLGAMNQDVELARGQHVRLRFEVGASSLAGTVVDSTGQRMEHAFAFARSEMFHSFHVARSDLYGHFDFGGLPPGRYSVTAERADSENESPAIEVMTGHRQLTLVVPDLARVTGRVTVDGRPAQYYRVAITNDPSADSRSTAVYDADGRFVTADAIPGNFALVITAPGFTRHVIDHVEILAGRTADIGDIALTRAPP